MGCWAQTHDENLCFLMGRTDDDPMSRTSGNDVAVDYHCLEVEGENRPADSKPGHHKQTGHAVAIVWVAPHLDLDGSSHHFEEKLKHYHIALENTDH